MTLKERKNVLLPAVEIEKTIVIPAQSFSEKPERERRRCRNKEQKHYEHFETTPDGIKTKNRRVTIINYFRQT